MTISKTQAGLQLETQVDEVSPHRLISLLLDGALERIEQAKQSLSLGNKGEASVLMEKIVGIVNGLRTSLDMESGGELANNLDGLYAYIANRISEAEESTCLAVLNEANSLLEEVRSGWQTIAA